MRGPYWTPITPLQGSLLHAGPQSETAIGPDAYAQAPALIREAFVSDRKLANLTFEVAEVLVGTMASPYVAKVEPEPMRAHQASSEPMRAHASK
jgi:hypothetical protein